MAGGYCAHCGYHEDAHGNFALTTCMSFRRERISQGCCVVDSIHCTAPAGFPESFTRTRCFACGENVCRNCSLVCSYHGYGRRRICHNCMEQHELPNADRRIREHLTALAGY